MCLTDTCSRATDTVILSVSEQRGGHGGHDGRLEDSSYSVVCEMTWQAALLPCLLLLLLASLLLHNMEKPEQRLKKLQSMLVLIFLSLAIKWLYSFWGRGERVLLLVTDCGYFLIISRPGSSQGLLYKHLSNSFIHSFSHSFSNGL